MFTEDRAELRRTFLDAWAKSRNGEPLEPLESQIVQVVRMHPEYQLLLQDPDDALDRDWLPEQGESNPFLHMALHLSVVDQLTTDKPAGIRRLHQTLLADTGDPHEAEHRIMECLATAIWHIQHEGKPFNEKRYFKCIKRAGGGRRSAR